MPYTEFGVTETGFNPKTPQTIRQEVLDYLKDFFGSDINTTDMEPIVKFTEAIAEQIGFIWQEIDANYANMFPQTASIPFIIKHANMRDLQRKEASKATTPLTFSKSNNQDVNVPAGTVVDNGSSGTELIEFETNDGILMPGVFTFVRSAVPGGTDYISGQPGSESFFNMQTVDWVAANPDGSSPYTLGADYNVAVDGIDWSPGGAEPIAANFYYVKVSGVSVYILATALEVGTKYNVSADTLTNQQTPVAGITSVNNDEDVTNGLDEESVANLMFRTLAAKFESDTDEDYDAFITNLFGIRAARVIENPGWYECIVAFVWTPVVQWVYDQAIESFEDKRIVGIIPSSIVEMERGAGATDAFPSPPYVNIESIEWVSDSQDGSSPYTEGVDYDVYTSGDDEIDWTPAGVEPGFGAKYYVKVHKAFTIAFEVQIWIEGTLEYESGASSTDVLANISAAVAGYIDNLDINTPIYKEKIVSLIVGTSGVKRLKDFSLTAVVRMVKGAANGTDTLPLENGTLGSVLWVSDNPDGSAPYTVAVDYTVSGFDIDWSPGGVEPPTGNYYYVKVETDSDIVPGEKDVAKLEGNDLV